MTTIFARTAAEFHAAKLDGPGRLWLILRHLDEAGRGWVSGDELRQATATPGASLFIGSWRRIRQLLGEGEGIFFTKVVSPSGNRIARIYYASEARVLYHFGVERVRGPAVEFTAADLAAKIAHVRARFYACWHRQRGEGYGNPITRAALQAVGLGNGATQRDRERRIGVKVDPNFAHVAPYERARWRQEQAANADDDREYGPAFTFVDHDGRVARTVGDQRQRTAERSFHIMRQLGNSYSARGVPAARRSGRRINQQLVNLRFQGLAVIARQGGDQRAITDDWLRERRFYSDDRRAARASESGDGCGRYAHIFPDSRAPVNWRPNQWREIDPRPFFCP